MKKDAIVQFVCFETNVTTDIFISQWEQYSNQVSGDHNVILQQGSEKNDRTKFISQHWCVGDDFQFVFKKGRRSSHNQEIEMKVREAGGYTAIQVECSNNSGAGVSKILVFVNINESDLPFYRSVATYQYLNIYQAYYESCTHGYVLEYFVKNSDLDNLFNQLKNYKPSAEIGVFKETRLSTPKNKKAALQKVMH